MTTYCVWFDNFFQELFSIEKSEFEKYDKLKKSLSDERNLIHYVEAESITDSFDKYKKMQEISPTFNLETIH